MGFSPRDMQRMSLFEYSSCLEGWQRAHEVKPREEDDGMTPELFRKIMDAPPTDYGAN